MALYRPVLLLIAAVFISACSNSKPTSFGAPMTTATIPAETSAVSRGAVESAPRLKDGQLGSYLPNAKIEKITVEVPRTLDVSERNSYYPKADIVWRGDPIGDRHAQVEAVVKQGAKRLADTLSNGTRPVNMHIQVTRFHALTEKARYSTGGVHNINFVVTLTDPATGIILRGPRHLRANLDAFGGSDAIAADSRGETQKVRISAFLAEVLRTELTVPGGYVDDNRGFFVALNRN